MPCHTMYAQKHEGEGLQRYILKDGSTRHLGRPQVYLPMTPDSGIHIDNLENIRQLCLNLHMSLES